MPRYSKFIPRLIHIAGIFWILTLGSSAHADQTDPRLPDLFEKLYNSPNEHAAEVFEKQIWKIWFAAPSDSAKMLLNNAQMAMNDHDFYSAREFLDRLIESEPKFSEAWNQRAIALFLERDFEGSLRDIDKVLDLEPRHFGALAGRGQCLIRLGRHRQALDAFNAALKINPWLPAARMQVEMLREYLSTQQDSI